MSETGTLGPVASAAHATLLEWIESGRFGPAQKLPAERVLAAELRINRGTLRQALAGLAAQGVISSAGKSGWFISHPILGEPPHTLQSFSEMAASRGLVAETSVTRQEVRLATFEEAGQLRLGPGGEVLHVERVRSLSGRPVCFDTSVIPLPLFQDLVSRDLTDKSLYREMEDCGVTPTRSDFTLQADAADEVLAGHLDLDLGSPVLVGVEVCQDDSGRPINLGRSSFRGDFYRFHATLFRHSG